MPAQRREPRVAGRWAILAAIAAGGMLGAEARYGVGLAIPHVSGHWPWATFLINASGCFLIGVLMVIITDLVRPHPLVRPFASVGFLGGYTTFSTYSVDLVQLWSAGRPGAALAYMVGTPVAAMIAVWAGSMLARAVGAGLAGRGRRTSP